MHFIETELKDVYIIENKVFEDNRGFLVKTFHKRTFEKIGLICDFMESFYSESKKNVIRGMHFQLPPEDHAKLVYVVEGKIFDVILDIRKNSFTYGKYISVELSRENKRCVYIPSGLAHGFAVINDYAIVVYLQTSMYSPEHEAGIRWDSFGMNWRIENPILSERDKSFPSLKEFVSLFIYKDYQ